MMAPDVPALRRWVLAAGLAGPDETVEFEPLGGGISNDVLAFRAGGRDYVLKQALAQLRVAAEWHSDITRIHREAACQRWLATVLAPGEVPAVVCEDEERHVVVMARAAPHCVNWKDELLAGRVHPAAAGWAGDLLGRIHAAGCSDAAIRHRLAGKAIFDELRLDPYLRTAAAANPTVAAELGRLVDELAAAEVTVVHGDFSPKNLLLRPDGLVLLDHEVAHIGDPRFDLGFLITHLVLKAVHLPQMADSLWPQPARCWAAYRRRYDRLAERDWLPVLGAVLLARLDGKSPAGYLSRAEEDRLRPYAHRLIRGELATLDSAVQEGRML